MVAQTNVSDRKDTKNIDAHLGLLIFLIMKTFKITSIAILMAIPSILFGQSYKLPSEVVMALERADAEQLSDYLNATVELTILSQNDVYSKQQATNIIADFFRKNTVTGFQALHSGNKDAASFAIGNLNTTSQTYRVYILIRSVSGQPAIQQLRIEAND